MDQRIFCEDAERFGDVGVVNGGIEFGALVVADAAKVAEKIAEGDAPLFLREAGDVALHRGIEVQFAALRQLESGNGGDGLGDRGKAVNRVRLGGDVVFQIGFAVAAGEAEHAVFRDRDAKANDLLPKPFGFDGLFDAPDLFRGPIFGAERYGNEGEEENGPPHQLLILAELYPGKLRIPSEGVNPW